MGSLFIIHVLEFIILLILIGTPPCLSSYAYNSGCNNLISCGNITDIGFPFWGGNRPYWFGHPLLQLSCQKGVSYITMKDVGYQILEANPDEHTLRITRVDYFNELCPSKLANTSLDTELFVYGSDYKNLTLSYSCTAFPNTIGPLSCIPNGNQYFYPHFGSLPPATICQQSVLLPVSTSFTNITDFFQILKAIRDGFVVRWIIGIQDCDKCQTSGGLCGYDGNSHQTTCSVLSPDAQPPSQSQHPSLPGASSTWNWRIKTAIGASAAGFGVAIVLIVTICYRKRHVSFGQEKMFMERRKSSDRNVEVFMQSYGSLAPKRFSYLEVKRITNTFRKKLGQGGYGVVYEAKLPDGRPVAVKVISESKGTGEEFINEVASISRTSHVNIVSLLGFCYEKEKRALIYEFMTNGSLDKFIYRSGSPDAICNLDWYTLYQIAIGIARGLEYLHRGCSTRILHLDIKPQNILLDEDFCPKISDFGLAKICQKKESIVSIVGTRGTIGYIAPEVFSRTFGGVSHKSDVYSFGMLILEMIGGRKNYGSGGSHTSEMYFPDWIYKDLEQGDVLAHCLVTTEEENERVRKMILVSLWCVQINPSDRPSMSKVVEMLEGPDESVPYPPKPVLYSPPMPTLQISGISSSNIEETNSIITQKDGSTQLNELNKSISVDVL